MPLDLAIAIFLSVFLTIFVVINLHNMAKSRTAKRGVKYSAEVEHPGGLCFTLAALGTGIYFFESILYVFLVFTGLNITISDCIFQLQSPFDSWIQLTGLLITAFGYFLFLWSVRARGRYATSWEMPENQELVTWGPYRYVRHPSYLAYFILFVGLFLGLLNLIALIPFVAVLGYVRITAMEEEMLAKRFGEAYLEYQRKTGRFLPKITQ